MNTNDLPLAQKLAALMEAGRAMHPEVSHVRGVWGDGKEQGCAMTFVALGAGLADLRCMPLVRKLAETLGATEAEVEALTHRVVSMNDEDRASMDEIIAAVREDRLPEARDRYAFFNEVSVIPKSLYISLSDFKWVVFDESAPSKISVGKVSASLPKEDKSVRVNARTGATWPKPKHSFA